MTKKSVSVKPTTNIISTIFLQKQCSGSYFTRPLQCGIDHIPTLLDIIHKIADHQRRPTFKSFTTLKAGMITFFFLTSISSVYSLEMRPTSSLLQWNSTAKILVARRHAMLVVSHAVLLVIHGMILNWPRSPRRNLFSSCSKKMEREHKPLHNSTTALNTIEGKGQTEVQLL